MNNHWFNRRDRYDLLVGSYIYSKWGMEFIFDMFILPYGHWGFFSGHDSPHSYNLTRWRKFWIHVLIRPQHKLQNSPATLCTTMDSSSNSNIRSMDLELIKRWSLNCSAIFTSIFFLPVNAMHYYIGRRVLRGVLYLALGHILAGPLLSRYLCLIYGI